MRGLFGRGVGWRVCVAFLEVLVTCADVLLAPGGRRRLAVCVVDGGLAAAVGRPAVPGAPATAGRAGQAAAAGACAFR